SVDVFLPRCPCHRGGRDEGAAAPPRGLGARSAPARIARRGVRAAPSAPPSVATRLPFMRILIVGNGGREHALLWKLRRDAPGAEFFITRGNGGTDPLATALPLDPSDVAALAAWAEAERIDLTVVGPEAPLDAGIVDVFGRRGLAIFGPTRDATAIESSKAYAKALMRRAGVPTAEFRTFTEPEPAENSIRHHGAPIVVKASGLAAGKGAVVCSTEDEALDAVRTMLGDRLFGEAGSEIVVEEFMQGEELSVFALTDGDDVLPLLASQDHKRIGEGDTGPNTGG